MIQKPDFCRSCCLCGNGQGYVPAHGSGANGVLIVAEAAGENETTDGIPLVGKAGHFLFSSLARVGIDREGFHIHNVLSCRPPGNRLAGMPYEQAAIDKCAPLLDLTIESMKPKVILTLGRTAFKRILSLEERRDARLLKSDYYCYPFWSERYNSWVIGVMHPSYLMRGNHAELPILQFGFKRALEIAADGLTLDTHDYLLDPDPFQFASWVQDFKRAYDLDPENTFLSYDIETPFKQGEDEEDVAKEDDSDYTILRVSFSYRPNNAVSVPWRAEYMPMIALLFMHKGAKVGWNNSNYDEARVRAAGIELNGDQVDAMLAWHVLNSAMPKGLGFVTPFYAHTTSMWKHLSAEQPAFYNAKDADMALRNWLGIRRDLDANAQGKVFDRHVTLVNRVFNHMRDAGVPLDLPMRADAETRLKGILDDIETRVEAAIPPEVRKVKVYKKTPKDTTGMIQVDGVRKAKQCPVCNALDVKAAHFKSIGKKAIKAGLTENPCFGSRPVVTIVTAQLWGQSQAFKISKVSMMGYQKALKHQAVRNRRENKVTFDEKAILKLQKKYPRDPLYPLILEHRKHSKLLGTYIGVTQYKELTVEDDYILQPGEKWADAV